MMEHNESYFSLEPSEDDLESLDDEEVEKLLKEHPKMNKKTQIFEGKVI
jgi:hypothetical protein